MAGKNQIIIFALIGFVVGLLFPVVTLPLLLIQEGLPFSFTSLLILHQTFSTLWVVDIAPLFLAIFLAFIAEKKEQHPIRLPKQQVSQSMAGTYLIVCAVCFISLFMPGNEDVNLLVAIPVLFIGAFLGSMQYLSRNAWDPRLKLYLGGMVPTLLISFFMYGTGGANSKYVFLLLIVLFFGITFYGLPGLIINSIYVILGLLSPLVYTPSASFYFDYLLSAIPLYLLMGFIFFQTFELRKTEQALAAEIEIKRLQDQLYQIQKMDSIGKFAGGIAHDFKNLLFIIQSYVDLAQQEKEDPEASLRYLNEIREISNWGINLTSQLLLFSQSHSPDLKPLDLNGTISGMLGMLRMLVGSKAIIETDLAQGLWTIHGDSHQLSQVVMNLVSNAKDAMHSGGEIRIQTQNVEIGENYCKTKVEAYPGQFVCLSVKDQGTGMDEATLAKIFEPFFTTKEAGQGTGLGLSVVYGIVKQHKGWIDLESKPKEGSTFKIYLPAIL